MNDFDSGNNWVWVSEFTWGIVKSESIKVMNNTQNYLIQMIRLNRKMLIFLIRCQH